MSRAVRWAPKLPVKLIVRLYEADATMVRDDELVGDVGWRLPGRGTAEARSAQAAVERRGRARGGAAAPENENPARRLSRDPCALGVERSLHPRRAHVAGDTEQRASVTAELDRVDAALAEPL